MADQIYKVRDPSGVIREIKGPAGATDEQVIAQAQALFAAPAAAKPEPAMYTPSGERGATGGLLGKIGEAIGYAPESLGITPAENIAGHPVTRFAKGAGDMILGGGQALVNAIAPTTGGKLLNETLASGKEMEDKGRKALGSEGFDWTNLAGNMVSPVTLGMLKNIPISPTVGGKVAQGAVTSGIAGNLAPDATAEPVNNAQKTITSALLGAAIPAGMEGARGVANVARNIAGPLEGRSGRLLNDVAGDKAQDVVNALLAARSRVPGENLTAGQASTAAKSPEFAALQEIVANRAPGKYLSGGIEGEQEAARQAALASKFGNENDIARAVAERARVTRPMRESALENANLAGRVLPELQAKADSLGSAAANKVQDVRRFSGLADRGNAAEQSGVMFSEANNLAGVSRAGDIARKAEGVAAKSADDSLILGEAGRFNQRLADSLAEHGNYPLTAKSIVGNLDAIIADGSQPTIARKALSAIKDDLLSYTDKNGVVNANTVYRIRKEIGNTIKQFADENKTWDKRLTAGIERDVQTAIDGGIEKAGGTGWRDYLKQYAQMSGDIDNAKSGQVIQNALREPLGVNERPAAFARATQNENNPITNAQQQNVINAVMESLGNNAKYNTLAKEGAQSATSRIGAELPMLPSAGMFNPKISMARAAVNHLTGRATNKVLDDLASRMDDPAAIGALMQKYSPSQRNEIVDALMRSMQVGAGSVAPQLRGGQP